ncbi:NAD/NADP octopine/nopaline dehydrogenase family protein [uncultured Serratia sp.]|uniref:NAD/NADP octopine/nopaline dehydrogenase family protein n=1 Tax=uncultured Serratia sp. TaxID=239175 RepID=UPI00258DB961|nr:NAD/NADP octopine/nopaline dehydrogenase family protein [uncultured Serratia sp.]HAY0631768.1 NAD/NADP octopine/nopaline dehydrogenase [Serratia marcescens]
MNILVIGAGNGGVTISADLSSKKHRVTLLKTSKSLHNSNFDYLKNNNGAVKLHRKNEVTNTHIHRVTDSFSEAFEEYFDLIIVYVQTNYHEAIVKKLSPYIKKEQAILFEPGYLSTAYVIKYMREKDVTVIEAESSPIDCRIINDGEVQVLFENVRNPVGVYPSNKKEQALAIISKLGYNFTLLDSVVEAALHNPNLIVHTIGAVMSIPRIEYSKGEYWMYKEVFTPSVWNLVTSLDSEKNDVLEKLGLKRTDYVEACKFRNSEDLDCDAKEIFDDYAQNGSPKGPHVSDSRYITEDVSQGLVLLESLGISLQVPTPTCSALINIAQSCLNMDFRTTGRTVHNLDLKITDYI